MSSISSDQSLVSKESISETLIDRTIEKAHAEDHLKIGQVLKSLIYGGLDGCVNTLIIILSSIAAEKDPRDILGICVAAIVGDSVGMGLGDYLSARAQIQYIKKEAARQAYEVQNFIGEELGQIIQLYQQKGFSSQEAQRISELLSTNKQAFVNVMMLEQLGLVVVEEVLALKCGITTFISFLVFGFLPIIPYVITSAILQRNNQNIIATIVIGATELFMLGYGKGKMIKSKTFQSASETLTFGAIITAIGFGIGLVFAQ